METRTLHPLSYDEAEEIRQHVEPFFKQVLAESRDRFGHDLPAYRLALDPKMLCLSRRRKDGRIMFFTCATGDTGPEGAIERSRNWVGFWDIADKLLEALPTEDLKWCYLALSQSAEHGFIV